MDYLKDLSSSSLREWIEAIVVVLATLFSVAAYRTIVRRLKNHNDWHLAWELGSDISNLGYVIGIRLFVEVAPINPHLRGLLDDLAYVVTVFVFMITIRRAAIFALVKSSPRSQDLAGTMNQGFIPLLKNLATLFIFLSGVIMILKHFSYDVMSLVAALGVGSLAVGLAAKETLSNMISGFMLIIDRNLRPGDRISFKGNIGDVQEIGLRSTRIQSGDGNLMIVPNFDLVNNTILNLSEPSRAGICSTQIRVSYSADFNRVKTLILQIMSKIPKVEQSRGKWVNLTSLSEGYQLISMGCWMSEMDDLGEVLSLLNQQMLSEFSQQKISLIEAATISPPTRTSP
jgi:MscS family membrane protein